MNPTISTLHTVNKSAFGSDSLASCLLVARFGDAILLLEDGVYNAVDTSVLVRASSEGIRIYALWEDLQARGIAAEQLSAHVEPIVYKDFVTLVCTHARTVNWF